MLTPTTCPKPIPGVCQMHLQTLSLSWEWKNHIISELFVSPPASIGLTFRPTRVMTSSTTSCWQRLRRPAASQWNEETRWSVCLCVNMCYCVQDSWKTIIVTATCRQAHSEPDTSLRSACSLPLLSPLSTFFPYRKLSEQLLESHPVSDFLLIFMFCFFVCFFLCCLCEIRRSN